MSAEGGLELVAAAIVALAGLLLLVRGMAVPSGWLLLGTSAAIPFLQPGQPDGALPLTLGLVLAGAAPALAACAGVLWPVAPLAAVDRVVVATALGCALLLDGLVPALLTDPVAEGCAACAPNLLEVVPAPAAADALSRIGAASAVLWGPAVALVVIRRLRTASALSRRQALPSVAAAGVAVLAAVAAARGLALPADVVDSGQDALRLLQVALVLALGAAVITRVVLVLTAGRRMARLVLAAMPDQALVTRSLRTAIADPNLSICYLRADGSAIDADGLPLPEVDGAALRLSRDGRPFAEVRYAPAPPASMALLRASAGSLALAIEYLAARARLRAELRDAAAVRSRLVEAGSAERWRLERNLHDGAQQRLVALKLMLTAASPGSGAALAAEQAEIDAALRELREVARGLFPAGLAESGLPAALRELGDHTPCPLLVSGSAEEPVPLPAKMAVYQLVTELASVHPRDVPLRVGLAGGANRPVEVEVETSLADSAELRSRLLRAEDRFVSTGGWLSSRAGAEGTVVRGEALSAS